MSKVNVSLLAAIDWLRAALFLSAIVFFLLLTLTGMSSSISPHNELEGCGTVDEVFTISPYANDPVYQKGESLFINNCAACHTMRKKMIGPALAKVEQKYEKEWLYKWIRNSQQLINSGDERANAIYAAYDESLMTAFPTLSEEDIDAILLYTSNYPEALP